MATGDPETSRRRALATVACGLSAGVAGCTRLSDGLADDAERSEEQGQEQNLHEEQTTNTDEEQSPEGEEDGVSVDPQIPTPPPAEAVGIDRRTDVTYRTTAERQLRLDVVRPDDDVVRPLLLHVHGGGWRQGAKGYEHAERMAQNGLAVASVEYRLSGEATFPAAVRDVVAAIKWLRAEATAFDVDPERVGLVGESAGGHLIALVAAAPTEPTFQPESFYPDVPVAVDAIVPISGIYDLTLSGMCDAPVTTEFIEGTCEERPETASEASPVTHVDASAPPALLFHGTGDDVIDYQQATTCRDALADAGVAVDLHTGEGAGHLLQDRADAFLPRQEAFLARHLQLADG